MHTPGPWKREAFGIWHTNEKGENRRVACAEIDRGEGPYKPSSEAEVIANANLIAAAPDLLDLVIAAYDRFTDNDMQPANESLKTWLNKAECAIAKAGVES